MIEAHSIRMRGHFERDSETFRDKEEVEEGRAWDPRPSVRNHLIERGIAARSSSSRSKPRSETRSSAPQTRRGRVAGPDRSRMFHDVYA